MNRRVLIFDDDADILEVCSIVLEEAGFVVRAEGNCDKIGEKIARFSPNVVLMDNRIPPSGGIHATREIKDSASGAQIPVVFFSANRDVDHLAKEARADFFLEKPFDLDVLVQMVTRACGDK